MIAPNLASSLINHFTPEKKWFHINKRAKLILDEWFFGKKKQTSYFA